MKPILFIIFSSILLAQPPVQRMVTVANASSTGTTVHKLAKLTGAPSKAVVSGAGDTGGAIGIVNSGAGTTGSATIQEAGQTTCVFDGATTAGHYVGISASVAGDCTDAGASFPTSGQVIGVVLSTNGGAGTYTVDMSLGQASVSGGAPPAGPAGCMQLSNVATFACSDFVYINHLMVSGGTTPTAGPASGGIDPANEAQLLLGQNDFAEKALTCISDGFCGAQYNWGMVASMGDVNPTDGTAATTGALYLIAGMYAQIEDTTTRGTCDYGFVYPLTRAWSGNCWGDFALNPMPPDVGNLTGTPSLIGGGSVFIMGASDGTGTVGTNTRNVGIGPIFRRSNPPTSQLQVQSTATTKVTSSVIKLTSQTADLWDCFDTDGTTKLCNFDSNGVAQFAGYKSSDASVGTTGNGFKNGLCTTASGACVGGAVAPNTPASFSTYSTTTNCADSAGAAACGSAAAGRFVADAAATTVVVSTTAVTANSEIFIEYDSSLSAALSVTCNATIPSAYAVTARTAGTSFTLSTTANVANPGCFSYHIVN